MASHADPELLERLDALLLGRPGVTRRQMMGHPSYLIPAPEGKGGELKPKMFCCALESGILLKLPPARIEELLARDGFSEFAPMADRPPMRGWIVVERDNFEEIEADLPLILEAQRFVEGGAN